MDSLDLTVVGAGPAGLVAARQAAELGLNVLIVDENPLTGGRLLGQLHEESQAGKSHWWKGGEIAHDLHERAAEAGVTFLSRTDVWGLFQAGERAEQRPSWQVCLGGEHARIVESPFVLLATGAGEKALSLPGWQLPGVMTVGAAQVMSNVHWVKPGKRVLIVGIDVLSLTIARELSLAGVEVVGLVLAAPSPLYASPTPRDLTERLLQLSHLAPTSWVRTLGPKMRSPLLYELATRFYPQRGIRVWDIPVRLRTACTEIIGTTQVEGALIAQVRPDGSVISNSQQRLDVDCVALAGGLYPLAELASVAGCKVVYSDTLGGHVPLHSKDFATTAPGIYIAGNISGIESAQVAMAQGKAAALSIAKAAGKLSKDTYKHSFDTALADIEKTRDEAAISFLPRIRQGRAEMQRLWEAEVDSI